MPAKFTESTVEEAALELVSGMGYTILHGLDIAPGELFAERAEYSDVLLVGRLKQALANINPKIPAVAIEDAIRKLLSVAGPKLEESNRRIFPLLTGGGKKQEPGGVPHRLVQGE